MGYWLFENVEEPYRFILFIVLIIVFIVMIVLFAKYGDKFYY